MADIEGIQLMINGQEAISTANSALNVLCENGNSVQVELDGINNN